MHVLARKHARPPFDFVQLVQGSPSGDDGIGQRHVWPPQFGAYNLQRRD
jgi:hypothetical protein